MKPTRIVSGLVIILMLSSAFSLFSSTVLGEGSVTSKDIEGKSPGDAAKTLETLDHKSAAKIMDELTSEQAGEILDSMNTTSGASLLEEMSEAKATLAVEWSDETNAAEMLEKLNTTRGVAILDDVSPEKCATILASLSTTKARDIAENMNMTDAVTAFLFMKLDDAVRVANEMNPTKMAEIVGTGVDGDADDSLSEVVMNMAAEKAARVTLEIPNDLDARVFTSMTGMDENKTARIVEDAVRLVVPGKAPVSIIATALSGVDRDTLAALFMAIARRPSTPSTVAYIWEEMDHAVVLNATESWIAVGELDNLGKVFGALTPSTLDALYSGLTRSERAAVSPYLSAQTIANLPAIGSFRFSDLTVTPILTPLGKQVSAEITVYNDGDEAGKYVAVFKVNGTTVKTEEVPLAPGASKTLAYSFTPDKAGIYKVVMDTQKDNVVISAPKPADFRTTSLTVSKSEVSQNEAETVTVTVGNVGEEAGSYDLVINVDGTQKITDTLTIDGGGSVTKTYTVTSDVAGVRTVSLVGGPSAQFTVASPNYLLYGGGGAALVAIAVLAFLLIRKK